MLIKNTLTRLQLLNVYEYYYITKAMQSQGKMGCFEKKV